MQFKVPQNVQREDRIVGPLTLRQLIICGIGGGIAYAIYVSLGKDYIWITWLPPVAIILAITALFAFIKPLDLTFGKFILTYLEFLLLPQKRIWIQASSEVLTAGYHPKTKSSAEQKAEEKAQLVENKAKKIMELSRILDTKSSDEKIGRD
ncbi:MAG: PrgI family protein [Candidatus Gracilibacteria bacterium]|jgi:hypothetical protein